MPRSSSRPPQGELLQGTLPLLILRTLATGPNHGFAIARRIQQISKAVLRIEQGSLYPALHRMELDGVIESYWGTTENNRKAKYLPIDEAGHARARQRNRAVEFDRRGHRGGSAGGLMPRAGEALPPSPACDAFSAPGSRHAGRARPSPPAARGGVPGQRHGARGRAAAGAARVRQSRRVPGRQPRPLLVPPDRGSHPRSALCRPRDAAVRRLHRHRGGIARRRHRRRHRDIRRDRGRHAAAAPRAQPCTPGRVHHCG